VKKKSLGAGDLEKNTDGHRGSFGLRRKQPRKLTGGLEEPQIWAETEKSQAAKTTQGGDTELKHEIDSQVSHTMSRTTIGEHHRRGKEKTGDRGLDTNSQQKQRSRGHEHLTSGSSTSQVQSKMDNTHEIKKCFFIEIKHDYNRFTVVTALPPSFDYWNENLSF
jgi:hypothetical protein